MSIGYVVISACATMPDRTCAERFAGVPIAYGLMTWLENQLEVPKPYVSTDLALVQLAVNLSIGQRGIGKIKTLNGTSFNSVPCLKAYHFHSLP